MAGELAAEWIRVPDGNGGLKKVWVRDSTARRDIAQLQTDVSGLVIPDPSSAAPAMDGTAAAGSSDDYARADHVHPSDTSKADVSAIPTKTSDLTNDSGFITADDTFFGTPTAIPSNADLDTYNTVGHYSAGSNTVAGSLTNCPTTSNFSLFVVWRTSAYKSQIIIAAATTLYYRYQTSAGWAAWRKITTTAV